jgi:hypothetical protein
LLGITKGRPKKEKTLGVRQGTWAATRVGLSLQSRPKPGAKSFLGLVKALFPVKAA